MKGGIGNIMKQAQKMQEEMQKAQQEIARMEVVGQSGGGLVKVTMTGQHELRRVEIDDSLMSDDKEMLEDLIAAAVNDASQRVERESKERMSGFNCGVEPACRYEAAFLTMSESGSDLVSLLIESLRCLPGVGPKSAQRMAFHLLQRDRTGAMELSECLKSAMQQVGHCRICRTFTESEVCDICRRDDRNVHQLCVVESPADVLAVERSTDFKGRYFVLMGHLSPLDGIGPKDIGLDQLEQLLGQGRIEEVILATNPTVEGSATANYISELAKARQIRVMRIAQGIPLGGELEYIDGGTLSHAFSGRTEL